MIFVDTGPFLARHLRNDQLHAKASRAWKDLGRSRSPLVTSNFVLDETFTLLARRASYAFAADRAEVIYSSRILTFLRPDSPDEQAALVLFRKRADQGVSCTDWFAFERLEDFRAATEKEFLRRKLLEFGGNIKRTAERIELQRSNLYMKLDR